MSNARQTAIRDIASASHEATSPGGPEGVVTVPVVERLVVLGFVDRCGGDDPPAAKYATTPRAPIPTTSPRSIEPLSMDRGAMVRTLRITGRAPRPAPASDAERTAARTAMRGYRPSARPRRKQPS